MSKLETDTVVRAGRAAIARAKSDGRADVCPDDLLIGVLQTIARFGIVRIGPWTIDLEDIGKQEESERVPANGKEVAWSAETADLFDRAAGIARRDGAPRVDVVHLLVAFSGKSAGIMGELKNRLDITSAGWRAALAEWRPMPRLVEIRGPTGGSTDGSRGARSRPELLSPDEAADLLGVHTQTVRGYIRSGKLPAHRLAGERAIRILRADVFGLLEPVTSDEED